MGQHYIPLADLKKEMAKKKLKAAAGKAAGYIKGGYKAAKQGFHAAATKVKEHNKKYPTNILSGNMKVGLTPASRYNYFRKRR